jgi:hypothetical protein
MSRGGGSKCTRGVVDLPDAAVGATSKHRGLEDAHFHRHDAAAPVLAHDRRTIADEEPQVRHIRRVDGGAPQSLD